MSDAPAISIIVPTYNRRARLLRLLRSLAAEHARGERFEVVVAVDGATDGTPEALAAYDAPYPLRWSNAPNRGPAAARNRAIAGAEGDLLLFLDDDVTVAPGLVAAHRAAQAGEERAVVFGPMLPPPDRRLPPWLAWEAAALQKQYDAMRRGVYAPTPRQFYTANASMRRALVLRAGGFDETFTRAEDVELAWRLETHGARFRFAPAARIWHEPDRDFATWRAVAYQYGRHDVLLARGSRPEILDEALEEWATRHRLNRFAAEATVGRALQQRLAVGALTGCVRLPLAPLRLRLAACSALFSIAYWQGIADESGAGKDVWRHLAAGRFPEKEAELARGPLADGGTPGSAGAASPVPSVGKGEENDHGAAAVEEAAAVLPFSTRQTWPLTQPPAPYLPLGVGKEQPGCGTNSDDATGQGEVVAATRRQS
jgi:GT2 family glycosyltransferase